MNATETKDGTIIEVFVKPNSNKFEVIVEVQEIVIRSTEEPAKGKVNKEIIKELTKLFDTKVELLSGATSRKKRLLISNCGKNDVERILLKKTV